MLIYRNSLFQSKNCRRVISPTSRVWEVDSFEFTQELVTVDDEGLYGRIEKDIARWSKTDIVEIARMAGFDRHIRRRDGFIILPVSPDLEAI